MTNSIGFFSYLEPRAHLATEICELPEPHEPTVEDVTDYIKRTTNVIEKNRASTRKWTTFLFR
jgi:hypothetical protein